MAAWAPVDAIDSCHLFLIAPSNETRGARRPLIAEFLLRCKALGLGCRPCDRAQHVSECTAICLLLSRLTEQDLAVTAPIAAALTAPNAEDQANACPTAMRDSEYGEHERNRRAPSGGLASGECRRAKRQSFRCHQTCRPYSVPSLTYSQSVARKWD